MSDLLDQHGNAVRAVPQEYPEQEGDIFFHTDDASVRFGEVVECVEIMPPQEGGAVRVRFRYKPTRPENLWFKDCRIWNRGGEETE